MSWTTDDGSHEGWTADTFTDDALGGGWGTPPDGGPPGVLVAVLGTRRLDYADWQYRPPAAITGWRGACDCGWRGPIHPRPAGMTAEDAIDAPEDIEDACHAAWQAHVEPFEGASDLRRLADEHTATGQRLDHGVRAARARGTSWAVIGDAVGITRQSAHERWRHVDTAPTVRQ